MIMAREGIRGRIRGIRGGGIGHAPLPYFSMIMAREGIRGRIRGRGRGMVILMRHLS